MRKTRIQLRQFLDIRCMHHNVRFSIGRRTVFSTADTELRPAVRPLCPGPLGNVLQDLGSLLWNLRQMLSKRY
jgi:hypothetical protein